MLGGSSVPARIAVLLRVMCKVFEPLSKPRRNLQRQTSTVHTFTTRHDGMRYQVSSNCDYPCWLIPQLSRLWSHSLEDCNIYHGTSQTSSSPISSNLAIPDWKDPNPAVMVDKWTCIKPLAYMSQWRLLRFQFIHWSSTFLSPALALHFLISHSNFIVSKNGQLLLPASRQG